MQVGTFHYSAGSKKNQLRVVSDAIVVTSPRSVGESPCSFNIFRTPIGCLFSVAAGRFTHWNLSFRSTPHPRRAGRLHSI